MGISVTESTISLKGIIKSIGEVETNEKTGFTKKIIAFNPNKGKVFYPQFHYQKIRLLDGFKEGDEVLLTIKIWGSETNQINNILADSIERL